MFKLVALFGLMFATCHANVPVSPPAPPQVYCGVIPSNLHSCVHIPSFHFADASKKCTRARSDCEKYTCFGVELSWLNSGSVNSTKLSEYLDHLKSENPDWSTAIDQAKRTCLVQNLPAQGYYLNCPAYDVTFCMLATLIQNVPPSLWSSSPECAVTRQYAAACPVCPEDCFAPAIPVGSCNACRARPRSP